MKSLRFSLVPLLLAVAGIAAPCRASVAPAPRAMTAIDLLELQRPGAPRLSPDGRQTLFTLTRADWERNRSLTDLWQVGLDDGTPRRMIEDGGGDAVWAPDSRRFAFTGRRGGDKVRQIYLMPADGGEATRLGHARTSVSSLAWPGDGRYVYFLAERPGERKTEQRVKSGDDMFPFESPRSRRALWRADTSNGRIEVQVQGNFDVGSYDVADDGTLLYRRSPSKLLDDQPRAELWLLRPGQPARRLTDNDYSESSPRLSPDGRRVLFLANAEHGRYGTVNTNLFVLDIASGASRELQHGLPWKIEQAEWRGDGREIVFSATTGVRRELFAVDTTRDRLRPIARSDFAVSSFSVSRDGQRLVYAATSATSPGEIHRTSLDRPAGIAITHFNERLSQRFRLPRQQAIQWTGPEGQALEGLLTYPLDHVPGRRYPLIVQNHGGPRSSDVFNIFAYGRFNPVLAAHGFMTLSVNYRGGIGYGDAFLQGMNAGYFKHADRDVLSGVDHLIALGLADPDRLGVMGWSAGGHMTNRLITVTDRFKAAASGAGAVDWPSMYLTSDTRWQRQEWFVTPPYGSQARRDLYTEYSPLSQLDRVRTPTLILAGHQDERVPWTQSVMLYRALKALDVETELYLAPREPHNFSELRHRLFQINVQMGWFSRHVTGTGYDWSEPPVPARESQAEAAAPDPADDA
ncbi:MAG: S9 family peptidase [Pseudomonas sp.]